MHTHPHTHHTHTHTHHTHTHSHDPPHTHTHTHEHHPPHTHHTLTIPCTSTHCPETPGQDACGTGAVFWAGNSLMEPRVRNFRWNGRREREKKKTLTSLW